MENQDIGEFLYREFCNHVYMGQWELSQAFALAITNSDQTENSVKMKLKTSLTNLSKNPAFAKNAWSVFPCPSYISLLSSQLLCNITQNEFEEYNKAKKLRDIAEFNVMLEEIFPNILETELKEFSSLYLTTLKHNEKLCQSSNHEECSSCKFSKRGLSIIQETLINDPVTTSLVLSKFCFKEKPICFGSLKTQICDIFIICLFNLISQIELSAKSTNSDKKLQELSKRLYRVLPLLPDYLLESNMEKQRRNLNQILMDISNLCKSGTLAKELVYTSFISRSSPVFLQYFCKKEIEQQNSSKNKNQELFKYQCRYLLQSIETNRHFLQSLLEYSIEQIWCGNFVNVKNQLSEQFLHQLLPLLLILSLNEAADSVSFSNAIEAIKSWTPSPQDDTLLVSTCQKLYHNIYFKDSCLELYMKFFPHLNSNDLAAKGRNIFLQLQTQSPLAVLQNCFGLKNIPPNLVQNLLNHRTQDSKKSQETFNSAITTRDSILYQAYLSIKYIVEAILHSSHLNLLLQRSNVDPLHIQFQACNSLGLDQSENSKLPLEETSSHVTIRQFAQVNGVQAAYSTYVYEPLNKATEALKCLFPITLRIEVLENLFSLLFLSSSDFCESLNHACESDEGHEGEEKVTQKHILEISDVTKDKVPHGSGDYNVPERCSSEEIVEKRYMGRFVISTVKLKVSSEGKSEQSEFASGHGSSRSTGSTSSNGFAANGFQCNELIVRDLLNILKDAILDAKADMFKLNSGDLSSLAKNAEPDVVTSITNEELQQRTSELEKFICEAHWRFQLVTSSNFNKKHDVTRTSSDDNRRFPSDIEGSHGLSKSRKKKKRKNKMPRNVLHLNRIEPNIIQRMLSSPDALLRYCLWRQNYKNASEVIKWCHLQSSYEAEEMIFAEHLNRLCEKLKNIVKSRDRPFSISSERTQFPNIAAISDAAESGLYSSTYSSVVSQEMSKWKVPKIPDVLDIFKKLPFNENQLLSGAANVDSIVLADLAYIRGFSFDHSLVLLDMAIQRWSDEEKMNISAKTKAKQNSVPFLRGGLKFLQFCASLITVVQACLKSESATANITRNFFPLIDEVNSVSKCFVDHFGPLEGYAFENQFQKWIKVSLSLEQFQKFVKMEENIIEDKQSGPNPKETLHISYKILVSSICDMCTWSTEMVRVQCVQKYVNYLKKLYNYLQQVAGALLVCKNQNASLGLKSNESCFSVLKESPTDILRKMVIQHKVPPEKVEKFAVGMKVDLAHVLVDVCFPKISLLQLESNESVTKITKISEPPSSAACRVLNVSASKWLAPRHPDAVARQLVKDLVSMIQDIVISRDSCGFLDFGGILALSRHSLLPAWMKDSSELAFVDLDLLQTPEQLSAFFINVNNAAWIHALLLNVSTTNNDVAQEFQNNGKLNRYLHQNDCVVTNEKSTQIIPLLSPYLIERLMAQKAVGYTIGQLGPVSIFDLRNNILHLHLPVPKHLCAAPYNLLLVDSNSVNPIWSKYLPPVEPRLLFVLCEGLQFSPKLQVMCNEIIFEQLDEAMKDYFNFYVTFDEEKQIVKLPELLKLHAQDFKDSKKDTSEHESLLKFIACNSNQQLSKKLNNISTNVPGARKKCVVQERNFEVQFVPTSLIPALKLDYSKEEESQHYSKNPDKSQSSTILFPDPVILEYLKDRCFIVADIYSFIAKDSEFRSSDNNSETLETALVRYLKLQQKTHLESNNSKDCSLNWFVSALSRVPSEEYCLRMIQNCLEIEQWENALKFIDIFMEWQPNRDGFFVFARQMILQLLASVEPSENGQPWSYALCITEPATRNETTLKNFQKWPEDIATKSLSHCLSVADKNTLDHLKTRLREIEVYKKILDAYNTLGCNNPENCTKLFNSWQDVAEYSIWDQSIILNCIKESRQYQLAVEWAKLHIIDNRLKLDAASMQIIYFLKQNPSLTEDVAKILEEFNSSELTELAGLVLPELGTISNQLIFVKFLIDIGLDYSDQLHYSNMMLGLKMLQVTHSDYYERSYHLVSHPQLLLEQLLINMEVKDAESAVKVIEEDLKSQNITVSISNLSINQLLENYAARAVELPNINDFSDSMISNTTVLDSEEIPYSFGHFNMPDDVPSKEQWVPDSRFRVCQVCNEEQFNMFSRRHHCRRCGRIVCSNCSQNTLVVKGYGKLGVRVCDDCYNQTMSSIINRGGSSPFKASSFDKRYRILSSVKVIAQRGSPQSTPEFFEQRPRANSSSLMENFYWTLTTNPEQNANIRNEFFFDVAPSVSLCLSILRLHSNQEQCAKFMLTLCDRLIQKLKSQPLKRLNPDVDHFLIIGIVKAFLVNAKLKYYQLHDEKGEATVDVYLQRLDIIKMLVNENCTHLIPKGDLLKIETVRNLRDRLVEEEQMTLAHKISSICGLDRNRVWASWGLFLLRAGDWNSAKEKFQYCLKKPEDRNNQLQESPTLKNILNCLESCNLKVSKKNLLSSRYLASSLKQIQSGTSKETNKLRLFDDQIKAVCLYYLSAYGSHFSTVAFYQRHGFLNEALTYIVTEKCGPEVFVEALFIPVLKNGELPTLQRLLISNDVTLTKWWNYLINTCRHLQRLGYLNVLYKMQLFMQDYVRAAKSCISFYLMPAKSYSDLNNRNHFLKNAKKHFETYLENSRTKGVVPSSILYLPVKEVESNIKTIKCQEEVVHFLHMTESQEFEILNEKRNSVTELRENYYTLPTLFGNRIKRSEVVQSILVKAINFDEGFDLAGKIVKEFGLNVTTVLCSAGKKLILDDQCDQLPHFLHNIKCFFEGANTDQVIMECIMTLLKQGGDVDFLIKLLTSDAYKINAYLSCGKLKNAYLLAIKLQRSLDVHRIMLTAEQTGQDAVKRFCEKWLQTNSQWQKPSTSS